MSDVELDYVEEAGPGIPELPAGEPAANGAGPETGTVLPAEERERWSEETFEQLLKGTGHGIHWAIGAGERDWLMTETDLERIVPPLTRICNRYEATLRWAPVADPILVAHGIILYGWRSVLERERAIRDRERVEGRAPAAQRYEPADAPEPDEEDLEEAAAMRARYEDLPASKRPLHPPRNGGTP